MGLSTTQAQSGNNSDSLKITDGVYAKTRAIVGVADKSGTMHEYIKKTFDIYLVLKFDDDRTQEFFGNLKRGADGQVSGWGGAFVVANIFNAVGETAELNAKDRFNVADLKKLYNKRIVTVSYTSGTYTKDGEEKQSYSDWNQTFAPSDDEEALKEIITDAWFKSLSQGYPNNYKPPMAKGNAPSKSGASKSSARSADLPVATNADFDDDLPF